MEPIAKHNDLGHSLCANLRAGDWMMHYLVNRLQQHPRLASVRSWLKECFACTEGLPRYLIPKYFYSVVMTVYKKAVDYSLSKMSSFVINGGEFVHNLALGSLQVYGEQPSAPLLVDDELLAHFEDDTSKASLAAGLPHFSTGFMRNWGRDTFISLRGLFLVTGRFQVAKKIILAYAVCVRHGLIPNLLDGGSRPRYNSRDSVWWFLQAVQDYCTMAPEGTDLLKASFTRLFVNDTPTRGECSIGEIIQEIMTRHAQGIEFREWYAGTQIDDRMQDPGFNVSIHRDEKTGFLYGGNIYNCGTWMDKMGESEPAGNRGRPATPRDGAPIEITGLLKSTLRWLSLLYTKGVYPHSGVQVHDSSGTEIRVLTYAEWDALVLAQFEQYYYIPKTPDEDKNYNVVSSIIARRGSAFWCVSTRAQETPVYGAKSPTNSIKRLRLKRNNLPLAPIRGVYKDVVGATSTWTEYQLRPNQCVAMVVAPELFVREHAQIALQVIEDVLLSKEHALGMKTLDPEDWNYCGDYGLEQFQHSTDPKVAGGFNYHQGPEWVWPLGYFLRAKVIFSVPTPTTPLASSTLHEVAHMVHRHLRPHRHIARHSPFRGLPELTNTGGTTCVASCATQAWSLATVLDAVYDVHKLVQK